MRFFPVHGQSFRSYEPKKSWRDRFRRRRLHIRPAGEALYAPTHRVEKLREPVQRPSRIKLYFGIFIGLMVLWLILLVELPFFRITTVSITGVNHFVEESTVKDFVTQKITSRWWPKNNFFLLQPRALHKSIAANYPEFATITIKKVFPHTLSVAINEKEVVAVYDTRSALFLIDSGGSIIHTQITFESHESTSTPSEFLTADMVSTTPSSTEPTEDLFAFTRSHTSEYDKLRQEHYGSIVLVDDQAPQFTLSQQVINPSVLETLKRLQWGIEDALIARVRFILIHDDGREGVRFYTDKPWYIIFNPNQDAAAQILNLQTLLRDKQPTQYVDVRFGDHVYWK